MGGNREPKMQQQIQKHDSKKQTVLPKKGKEAVLNRHHVLFADWPWRNEYRKELHFRRKRHIDKLTNADDWLVLL